MKHTDRQIERRVINVFAWGIMKDTKGTKTYLRNLIR